MSESTEFEVATSPDINATEDEAPRTPTARDEIMANIAARRVEQMERENAQAAIYDREATEAGLNFPTDDPEPTEQPAPRELSPPVPSREASPPPASVAGPQVHTITDYDGRQFQVTQDQMTELARLGMVANVALHSQPREAPAPAHPVAPPQPMFDAERIRDTVRQIQYGGEDAAAEALTGLVTHLMGTVPQQVDPRAIVSQAVAETQARVRLEHDNAVIRQEYADLFEHPLRAAAANQAVGFIRQRNQALGRQQAEIDIYREAGNEVRNAFGLAPPAPVADPQPQPTTRADVLERKRNAPRPTPSVGLRAPAPAAPRAPTGSDIVEQMRKARGQSSMR